MDTVAARTLGRVNRRLMPFVLMLYIISYLDRVNVGYAGLQMSKELGFSDYVFGLGGGIFFAGYFLLEIPGSLLAEVWSARKWIARIMITWGVVASLTGFIHTAQQFYWLRFVLGIAEAGFVPGIIVYLSHWYRPEDRGKAIAIFFAAIPASAVIGGPLSAIFLKIHWLGYAGWRWLLILEGLPAVIIGIVTIFYLTDRPEQARWLEDDEREWLAAELLRAEKPANISVWQTLRNPTVLLMAVTLLLGLTATYGVSLWLPQMVQRLSTFAVSQVSLVSAIPNLCAIPAMLLTGWHSDKTGERKWHAAFAAFAATAGFALSQVFGGHPVIVMASFSLAAVGIMSFYPPFWALPTQLLSARWAAASFGFINLIANLGGFAGPYMVGFLTDRTGTYVAGVLLLVSTAVLSSVVLMFLSDRSPSRH